MKGLLWKYLICELNAVTVSFILIHMQWNIITSSFGSLGTMWYWPYRKTTIDFSWWFLGIFVEKILTKKESEPLLDYKKNIVLKYAYR